MKSKIKSRGDTTLFTPGVDRRNFLRRVGSCAAAATVTASAVKAAARSSSNTMPNSLNPTLDQLSQATFAPLIGSTFQMSVPGGAPGQATTVKLMEATLLPDGGRPASLSSRAPFSLVFRAAADVQWPQRIYRLDHPSIGMLELFLVPIGADAAGRRYEAVFN